MGGFWKRVETTALAQGDLFPDCHVPSFSEAISFDGEPTEIPVSLANLIVVTQSCDLANNKVAMVAMCQIHTLSEFEAANPAFRKKGKWEEVRKGRKEALHMLASPESPGDNRDARVVDFGQIFSLPTEYLSRRVIGMGQRWRLASPFLEHFSQAFARFFMRVGLPSSIPPFK